MSTGKPYSKSKIVPIVGSICKIIPRGRGWLARFAGRVFFRRLENKYILTRYGTKMVVDPRNLDFYATMHRWGGSWEHWVFDTLHWLMPEQGVFYDIGGNVGYMSLEMAQRKPDAQIYCFEPVPNLAENIKESAWLNGFENRLKVFETALSDTHNETVDVIIPAHQIHTSLEKQNKRITGTELTIKLKSLDILLEEQQLPLPDLIKIDIEGHEKYALLGAINTLKQSKPHVLIEINSHQELRDIQEILNSVSDYKLFHARGSYRPLLEINEGDRISATIDTDESEKIDVIAVCMTKTNLPDTFTNHLKIDADHN